MDSKPLHDTKGHLLNLFNELPWLFQNDMKDLCTQIIQSYKAKEKITCADLRQVLIHLYSCLLEKVPTEKEILQLVETAVRISEMMYLPSTQHSPKHILQLYNCTWLHHTLCRKLLSPESGFYGSYIHHIVAHAPVQFEIVSLSSTTIEAEGYLDKPRLLFHRHQIVIQIMSCLIC